MCWYFDISFISYFTHINSTCGLPGKLLPQPNTIPDPVHSDKSLSFEVLPAESLQLAQSIYLRSFYKLFVVFIIMFNSYAKLFSDEDSIVLYAGMEPSKLSPSSFYDLWEDKLRWSTGKMKSTMLEL